MPEMTVTVRWPDGRVAECYSPSLVMHDHLTAGATYTVEDFTRRSRVALDQASERVRVKYGFACTASAASLERIHRAASDFEPDAVVEVVAMHPPLPPTAAPTAKGHS